MYPARQLASATKPAQIAVPARPKVKWLPVSREITVSGAGPERRVCEGRY